MEFSYTFSRLEPCYTTREQTGICHLIVGLTCVCTGEENGVPFTESAYIDNTFDFDSPIDYNTLTGNLETYANNFATEQGWWNILKERVSGKVTRPIQGPSVLDTENLSISANPVE